MANLCYSYTKSTFSLKYYTGSHIVTISVGPNISDALIKSPILSDDELAMNAGAGGFDFIDPNTDPELALALRYALHIIMYTMALYTI